jgi:imidazolonepropionase-like amidohydrolase
MSCASASQYARSLALRGDAIKPRDASRLGTAVRALVQAVLLLVQITANAADDPQTGVTALVNATVIDGTGNTPRGQAVVLVSGERIRAVGPLGEVVIPEGARVVDMSGKWIIPGLVDAHIHLFQSGGLYTRPDIIDLRSIRPYAAEVDWVRARLPMTLARYLASGVTAVLDVGGPFWTFEARERSKMMPYAPQVAVTGPLISSAMPSELRVADPPILEVSSPAEARAAVRRVLAERPDLIKLWWIPEAAVPLAEQTGWVRAAIEESHRAGVRVAVHATQLEVARAAVRAGADVLVHSVDDRRVDDGFVRLLKERDVVYVTTLGVNQAYREVFEQRFKPTDLERRLGDAEVVATLDDLADLSLWKGAFWRRWLLRWPDPRIASWNLRRLHEAGVTIAAGSDAGNIGTLHGPALHRELERMAEAGLAPLAILKAATQGGARAMGRGSDLGTLEPGKRADLLVLDADPQSDIRHVRRIHRVVRGGVILNADQITNAHNGQPPDSETERHD